MRRLTLIRCAIIAIAILPAPRAAAEFRSGVETFDGTAKDPSTWRERINGPATIIQNDALYLNTLNTASAEYTADAIQVPVGSGISAHVTITDASGIPGQSQNAWIGLRSNINNFTGQARHAKSDTRFFGLDAWRNFPANFSALEMAGGSGISHKLDPDVVPQVNHPYVLSVERMPNNQVRFAVTETDGTPLNTLTRDLGFTGDLFLVLGANSVNAVFDNVTAQPIPEPGPITLLSCIAASLTGSRRRRPSFAVRATTPFHPSHHAP